MKRFIQLASTAILLIHLVVGRNASADKRRVLATLNGQAGVTASSLCYLPSGVTLSGPSNCPGGEVHLLGQYVNLGIHLAGSIGTKKFLDSTYYVNKPLGIIADYDRNGFSNSNPPYSGDFCAVATSKLEGTIQYHVNFCSMGYVIFNTFGRLVNAVRRF